MNSARQVAEVIAKCCPTMVGVVMNGVKRRWHKHQLSSCEGGGYQRVLGGGCLMLVVEGAKQLLANEGSG